MSGIDNKLEFIEEVVKKYQGKVLGYTRKILGDEAMAEDATQEAFIRFYENLDKFDTKRPIEPWLYKIAKNISLDIIRKNRKLTGLNWEIESEEESVVTKVIKREERGVVRAALKKIGQMYRKPLEAYYFDNMSYKQIAKALKLPLNTVRTRIRRGKKMLEKELL